MVPHGGKAIITLRNTYLQYVSSIANFETKVNRVSLENIRIFSIKWGVVFFVGHLRHHKNTTPPHLLRICDSYLAEADFVAD